MIIIRVELFLVEEFFWKMFAGFLISNNPGDFSVLLAPIGGLYSNKHPPVLHGMLAECSSEFDTHTRNIAA